MNTTKRPHIQDFSDLGRCALDNLYMCRQCYTDEEKFNLLVEIILKIKGSLYTTNQTLKSLEWYVLDLWGFEE